jgi:hypothetical protein
MKIFYVINEKFNPLSKIKFSNPIIPKTLEIEVFVDDDDVEEDEEDDHHVKIDEIEKEESKSYKRKEMQTRRVSMFMFKFYLIISYFILFKLN